MSKKHIKKALPSLKQQINALKRGGKQQARLTRMTNIALEQIGALYVAEKYDECLDEAQRRLQTDQNNFDLLHYAGTCLVILKRFSEAIPIFDHCIKVKANVFSPWVMRGDCYTSLKQYDQAIRDYSISFSLEQDNWSAYDKCARAYYLSGRTEEAIHYEEYAVKKGGDSEATLVLVEMLKRIGERERARTVAKKGFKRFPEDPRFREFIDELKGD